MKKMGKTNRQALVEFLRYVRNDRVTKFPTQSMLYRAIEVIKFPYLGGANVPVHLQTSSMRQRHKNIYAPNNYFPIVNYLITGGYNYGGAYTNHFFIKTQKFGDRCISYEITNTGQTVLFNSPEAFFENFLDAILQFGPESEVTKMVLDNTKSATALAKTLPAIVDVHDSNSYIAKRVARERLKKHDGHISYEEAKELKRSEAEYLEGREWVKGWLETKEAEKQQRLEAENELISFTRQELQELYYIAGFGSKNGALVNKEVAEVVMEKLSAAIFSK